MHLHASTCVRPGFTREYIVPNEPYSHFMLVSQARAVRKSSHRLLPESTTCSTPDFTFLSQAIFPLTFAIFGTCNANHNKEELSLGLTPSKVTPSIIPSLHTAAERVWDMAQQVAPCLTVLQPWHKSGICHDFSSPYLQVYADSNRENRNLHPSIKENLLAATERRYFLLSERTDMRKTNCKRGQLK